MDPNEALEKARNALAAFRSDKGASWAAFTAASDLADAFAALDEWLIKGGFLPSAWRPTPDVSLRAVVKSRPDLFDLTEADEAATSKDVALQNLRDQIAKGETAGVVAMYERAALNAGARIGEIAEALDTKRGNR